MVKGAEVIDVRENYWRHLFVILARFLRFLEGSCFRKSLKKSELSDRSQRGKILKTIELVSYSIRYCKVSLLIYQGAHTVTTLGLFRHTQ